MYFVFSTKQIKSLLFLKRNEKLRKVVNWSSTSFNRVSCHCVTVTTIGPQGDIQSCQFRGFPAELG